MACNDITPGLKKEKKSEYAIKTCHTQDFSVTWKITFLVDALRDELYMLSFNSHAYKFCFLSQDFS